MIPTAVQPVVQIGPVDCGIAVLSMYLGVPYVDASRAAVAVDKDVHKTGLSVRELQRAARVLDRGPLKRLSKWQDTDLYEVTAILWVAEKGGWHWALLFEGVVIDPSSGMVWDLDAWLETKKYEVRSLLYEDSLSR